jgi:Uma2 family endonuclease
MAIEPRTPVSPAELLRMPRGTMRREVVNGELREMNPAGAHHGRIAVRVGRLLDEYAERNGGFAFGAEPIDCAPAMPGFDPTPDARIPLL